MAARLGPMIGGSKLPSSWVGTSAHGAASALLEAGCAVDGSQLITRLSLNYTRATESNLANRVLSRELSNQRQRVGHCIDRLRHLSCPEEGAHSKSGEVQPLDDRLAAGLTPETVEDQRRPEAPAVDYQPVASSVTTTGTAPLRTRLPHTRADEGSGRITRCPLFRERSVHASRKERARRLVLPASASPRKLQNTTPVTPITVLINTS